MPAEERIDISTELQSLCAKLGIKYNTVAEIVFRPGDIEATVFLENEDGNKYIVVDQDGREGVAQSLLLFKVRT